MTKYLTDNSANNFVHSYEVIKIELLNESNSPLKLEQDSRTVSPIEATKLLQGVEKSYEKGKYLLDDSSKVVDENGEPLVMYHGTNEEFTEFKDKKSLDASYHKRNNPSSAQLCKQGLLSYQTHQKQWLQHSDKLIIN